MTLEAHVQALRACRACPQMQGKPVCQGAVQSPILLIGQAPGTREEAHGKLFAWTAGKTLFSWIQTHTGVDEETFRQRVFMAAVCRCFPGKSKHGGGDRVPDAVEIENCSRWLHAELQINRPRLLLPVGKLAIAQFITAGKLEDTIGKSFRAEFPTQAHGCDVIPLPHPSGASPWHRKELGKQLIAQAMKLIQAHPAWKSVFLTSNQSKENNVRAVAHTHGWSPSAEAIADENGRLIQSLEALPYTKN